MSWPADPRTWLAALVVPLSLACGLGGDEEIDPYYVEITAFESFVTDSTWYPDGGYTNISGHALTPDDLLIVHTRVVNDVHSTFVVDPLAPQLTTVAWYEGGEHVSPFRSAWDGDHLIALADGQRVQRWKVTEADVYQPASLSAIDFYAFGDRPVNLLVDGDDLYVACETGNIYLFDLADLRQGDLVPEDADVVFSFDQAIYDVHTWAMAPGGWLWVGTMTGKFLVDWTDRSDPHVALQLGDRNEQNVYLHGDSLLSHGRVWDVSDPMDPQWVDFLPNSFSAFHPVSWGDYVISTSGHGIAFADFSDPLAPVEVGFIDHDDAGPNYQLSLHADRLFLQDDFGVHRATLVP